LNGLGIPGAEGEGVGGGNVRNWEVIIKFHAGQCAVKAATQICVLIDNEALDML